MDTLLQDLRYAARSLGRSPALSFAAVLTLGLGIGANTAMFGVVDRLFFWPPAHVVNPGRVVRLNFRLTSPRWGAFNGSVSTYPRYEALRDHANSFAAVAAYSVMSPELSLGLGEHAQPVKTRLVTADFFALLGVRPALGRFFSTGEERSGDAAPLAVLSEEFWTRHFGRDRTVLGRQIQLGRTPYSVIGVAPRGFAGIDFQVPDVWLPVRAAAEEVIGPGALGPDWGWLDGIARLRPGTSRAKAAGEATVIFRNSGRGPDTSSIATLGSVRDIPGPKAEVRLALWLTVACGIVLLIACVNVTNLLIARASQQQREIAVRLALGASRVRLVGQLLAESSLLAALGGAAAVLMVLWVGPPLQALLLPDASAQRMLYPRMLVIGLALVLLTTVLSGLVPALQASNPSVTGALKSGAREGSRTRSRLRSALLVGQVALTLTLLTTAGLFFTSLRHARRIPLGFDADRLISASVALNGLGYKRADIDAIYERVRQRVRRLPGVTDASLVAGSVFGSTFGLGLSIPGRDSLPLTRGGSPTVSAVTTDYFKTLGTRIVRGRGFTEADEAGGQRDAVVNQTMAALYWPGQSAVGECFRLLDQRTCTEVVGVAEDAHVFSLQEEPRLQVFIPLTQRDSASGTNWPVSALYVRTGGPASALLASVLREVQATATDLPYPNVSAVATRFDEGLRTWRIGSLLLGLFGGLGLLLAAIGLYGVLSYTVSQRTSELGIRIALGAGRRDLLGLVVRQGLVVTVVGLGIGVIGALAAGKAIAALLYEVSPRDPLVLSSVAMVLLLVALVASYLPARRATRVDPMVALRTE